MKLKKIMLTALTVILSGLLAACGASSKNPSTTSSMSSTNSSQSGSSLSTVNSLMIGILKLEGTENAVTADQAAQLLPLWQAYRSLSSSQTAAEAEVDGLLKQIEGTMTTEQTQAIKNMNLTSADLMSMLQSLGPGMGPQGTPNPNATPGADFPSGGVMIQGGGPPEGFSSSGQGAPSGGSRPNPPSGGMIMSGGPGGDAGSAAGVTGGGNMLQGTQDPSAQATAQARFSTQASQVNPMLLNLLISKLQALAGGNSATPTPAP